MVYWYFQDLFDIKFKKNSRLRRANTKKIRACGAQIPKKSRACGAQILKKFRACGAQILKKFRACGAQMPKKIRACGAQIPQRIAPATRHPKNYMQRATCKLAHFWALRARCTLLQGNLDIIILPANNLPAKESWLIFQYGRPEILRRNLDSWN